MKRCVYIVAGKAARSAKRKEVLSALANVRREKSMQDCEKCRAYVPARNYCLYGSIEVDKLKTCPEKKEGKKVRFVTIDDEALKARQDYVLREIRQQSNGK